MEDTDAFTLLPCPFVFEHFCQKFFSFTMKLKQVYFDHSFKNIPLPTEQMYLKAMLNKLEHFIKRLRRKAFFLLPEKG